MKTSVPESKRLLQLEKTIEAGQKTFVEVGCALAEIRDAKLYKNVYDTFEDYCREKWGWKRSYAYQLIDGSEAVRSLPEKMSTIVDNQGQARELAKVPEEKRVEVVEKVAKKGKVTAQAIRETAAEVVEEKPRVQSADEILTDDAKWKNAFGGTVPKVTEEKPDHPLVEILRCEIANLSQLIDDIVGGSVDCSELADVVAHRKEVDKAIRKFQKEKCE